MTKRQKIRAAVKAQIEIGALYQRLGNRNNANARDLDACLDADEAIRDLLQIIEEAKP